MVNQQVASWYHGGYSQYATSCLPVVHILEMPGPEVQGPNNLPLHSSPLHPVLELSQILLLSGYGHNFQAEKDLIKIQTTDIFVSQIR